MGAKEGPGKLGAGMAGVGFIDIKLIETDRNRFVCLIDEFEDPREIGPVTQILHLRLEGKKRPARRKKEKKDERGLGQGYEIISIFLLSGFPLFSSL